MMSVENSPATTDPFVVSPPSEERNVNGGAAVFFEDVQAGWGVGVVVGTTAEGDVMVRDPQRDIEVRVPSTGIVPVPNVFSTLTPETFSELPTLGHLPDMPHNACEPATLITLLHRMSQGKWETPVITNPPLVMSFSGASDDALQQPLMDLADAVANFEADRCVVSLPTGSGLSLTKPGRIPFDLPNHYAKIPLPPNSLKQSTKPVHAALFTLIESLTTYSTDTQSCVSGMIYFMEVFHGPDGYLNKIDVNPIAVDHSLAAYLLPYPSYDSGSGDETRGPYLVFLQLVESAMIAELGLPPQSTLVKMMKRSSFDDEAPTFADVRGALETVKVGGIMGVQMWAIVGAIMHLMLARWVLLATAEGREELPFGVLPVDDHVAWAAKCLQVSTEHILMLIQQQETGFGKQLDFAMTEAALTSLAGCLYERLVRYVFGAADGYPMPDMLGFSTYVINVLPFEEHHPHAAEGFTCNKLADKEYLINAVQAFYERHAPEKARQTEYVVSRAILSDKVSALLASLEGKYGRHGWFAGRERLHDLYMKCRPELASSIDDLMLQYNGKEKELFDALEAKYSLSSSLRPPLEEQLEAFFKVYDPEKLNEARKLALKWEQNPDELERQLSQKYDTQFLECRKQAWNIYKKHNPNQVQNLDTLLTSDAYKGNEEMFLAALKAKYEAVIPGGRRTSYDDLFRLVKNSIYEVFNLLFMHHFYPRSEGIETRQTLVDMLVSTAAPSVVASAMDSLTLRRATGEEMSEEVTARFGGGVYPKVHHKGAVLTVEHTHNSCSYEMSGVHAMNVDPVTSSSLADSANTMLRGMCQVDVDGATYVSRCMKYVTAIVATLGTVESPTSWVLHLDTHKVHSDHDVHIPTVLNQVRSFYIDLIGSNEKVKLPPAVTPPREPTKQQKERQEALAAARKENLKKPLPAGLEENGGAGTNEAQSEGEKKKLHSVALQSAATKIKQAEWTERHVIDGREGYLSSLLWMFHDEGKERALFALEEFQKRNAIINAVKMRTAFTMLAESILRIEHKEHAARGRIMNVFYRTKGLYKMNDLEHMGRVDILRKERQARKDIYNMRGPVAAALQRREIKSAYDTHFRPKPVLKPDINRFLELLEEDQQKRPHRSRLVNNHRIMPPPHSDPTRRAGTPPLLSEISSNPSPEGLSIMPPVVSLPGKKKQPPRPLSVDKVLAEVPPPVSVPAPEAISAPVPSSVPAPSLHVRSESVQSDRSIGVTVRVATPDPDGEQSSARSISPSRARPPILPLTTPPIPLGPSPPPEEDLNPFGKEIEAAVEMSARETVEAKQALDHSRSLLEHAEMEVMASRRELERQKQERAAQPLDMSLSPLAVNTSHLVRTPTVSNANNSVNISMLTDTSVPQHLQGEGVTATTLREWANWLENKRDNRSHITSAVPATTPRSAIRTSSPYRSPRESRASWTASRIDNSWRTGTSPTKGHHFLHKGHGVLVSDGVQGGQSRKHTFSPTRQRSVMRGRLGSPSMTQRSRVMSPVIKADPPKDAKSVLASIKKSRSNSRGNKKKVSIPESPTMPSPLPANPPAAPSPFPANRTQCETQLRSFDSVRGLVVKLVELQQMLEDPENNHPETQHLLSNRMLDVREALAACQN